MTSPIITWTRELAEAAAALGRASYAYETTIPERAREMAFMRAGQTLTPMQLDCVAMLRSRMHERTPEENAFNVAWATAWDQRTTQEGDRFDHALVPRDGEVR